MPDESPLEFGECAFCDRARTAENLLYEARDFYVLADYAPVADAHILLIPRDHYPHLAALPSALEDEFIELKALVGGFVESEYGKVTYWENGVFGQSVPHAHLHVLSVGMDTALIGRHGTPVASLADLRAHHARTESHYFLVEHDDVGRVMPPDRDLYLTIITDAKARNGNIWQYTAAERRVHGRPRVEALIERWRSVHGPSVSTAGRG